MSKTDNILYGDIHVYDYEHSGDSRAAYNILASFGITDTYFQNNGDGNVAIIEFSMPYNKENACILAKRMDNAGYGVSFINLYEFEPNANVGKVRELLKPTSSYKEIKAIKEKLPSWYQLNDRPVEGNLNAPVVISYNEWLSAIERDRANYYDNKLKVFSDLNCKNYYMWSNDREIMVCAVTTLGEVRRLINNKWKETFKGFLFAFCNPHATRYGESLYGLPWWVKDYPAFTKHILNIE